MSLKKVWLAIINNGIKEGFDEDLKIHIKIANFIAILIILFTLPFIIINLNDVRVALIRSSAMLVPLVGLFFIYIGWHKFGRLVIALAFPLIIYILGALILINEGTFGFAPKMWIIGSSVLPFMVFDYKDWKYIILSLLVVLFLLLTFDKVNAKINLPGLTQNLDRPQMRRIATIGTFLLITSVVFYVKKELFYSKEKVKEQNNKLQEINQELVASEEEIKQANAELQTLNEDLNEKKTLLANALKDIRSSLNYAKTIQEAIIFPRINILKDFFKEYFYIYKPKEEVGGDFIFIENINDFLAIAFGDATGHGIPGALMSMMAISVIDRALHNKKLKTPGEKLSYSRDLIINLLKQGQTTSKDGFDVALIMYYPEKQELLFSGAGISLYKFANGQIEKYKADRYPIGYYATYKYFNDIQIDLNPGDVFYIFSDGFIDQFGGNFNTKLGRKNIEKILARIANLPMAEQKNILEDIFIQWMGNNKQIDDISFLGFRI